MELAKDKQQLSVIIIGAGITGLLIAQGLAKAGIPCSVWEAEDAAVLDRSADWGMGVHWSLPLLHQCLPQNLLDRIQQSQTDPFAPAPDSDTVPICNGQTGAPIKLIPIPKMHRVSRRKFRILCAEGMSVQYNKKVVDITSSEDNTSVTATFEDGTEVTGTALVGSDGHRSVVRRLLLGEEKAAPSFAPYTATRIVLRYPKAEQAIKARSLHPINAMAVHPAGIWSWISILDVDDPFKPETWTFQLMSSWARDADDDGQTRLSNDALLAAVKAKTAIFADPIKSANEWVPEGTHVYMNRVSYWQPIPWDNRKGSVTLAGDGAHPMTFHRGQGLNHAVADAARFVDALQAVSTGASSLADAVSSYDKDIIARGGEEVRVSKMNTEMVHQWENLMNSPLMSGGADRS